ncbi:hypothetical protein D3C80_1748140 [compost metagenome]
MTDFLFRPVGIIANQRQIDNAVIFFNPSPDPRDIHFLGFAFTELTFQLTLSVFGQRHHDHAAGGHIQTMDGFGFRKLLLNARHQAVLMLGQFARHRKQPAWLIDHHDVFILKNHL